jgi:hypothetical protein
MTTVCVEGGGSRGNILLLRRRRSSAAGWPDEFVKKRPKCSPRHFIVKTMRNLNSLKKLAKNVGSSCNFQSNRPKLTVAHWANFRPIWSPWSAVMPKLGQFAVTILAKIFADIGRDKIFSRTSEAG